MLRYNWSVAHAANPCEAISFRGITKNNGIFCNVL